MLNKNDFTKKIEKYKRKVWIPKVVNEDSGLTASKFLGTPVITDNYDWPICPNCGKKMQYLMQLDSEGNIPYVFGEYGVGLLTQCEEHKEILTFHWNSM